MRPGAAGHTMRTISPAEVYSARLHVDLATLTLNLTLAGLPGPLLAGETPSDLRAPLRNRTVDLLLTMETLCRLS